MINKKTLFLRIVEVWAPAQRREILSEKRLRRQLYEPLR